MIKSITNNEMQFEEEHSGKALPQIKGLPIVGVLPQLMIDPFGFITKSREQYGDIYQVNLGFTNFVVCNHPRHAQWILRDNAQNYRKGGAMWDSLRTMVGNGLVVSEGAFWLRQRRLIQPQFHRQRLAGLTSLMIEAIQESLDLWLPAVQSGEIFDLQPALSQLTMRVVIKTLFGGALSGKELDEIAEDMGFALNYTAFYAMRSALPKWMPFPGERRYQRALTRIDKVIYRIIAEGRKALAMEQEPANHLLALLLDIVDDETGERMDDRQLRDEVTTFFLAGYETTAIALSWLFAYLVQYPEVMQKARAEVEQVVGQRTPTFADLHQMPYSRMVMQEVMRIRPPSFWNPRATIAEDQIDGYTIPADAQVVSMTYTIHHHPQEWQNPEEFNPERFTPENSAGRHPFAWIPFGAGQRLCIGRDFSLMEGQLALILVLQRFQLSAASPTLPQQQLSITLRPKGGVKVWLGEVKS